MLNVFAYLRNLVNRVVSETVFKGLNISIPVLMSVYIFLNPMPFSSIREICFYASLAILITLLIFKNTDFSLRSPLTLPFILFSLWAVIGLLFTLDFNNTLHDLRTHLFKYLFIFYLLINYFNSKKKLEILSWVIITSATVFSIGAIITYYFIQGAPFDQRLVYVIKWGINTNYISFTTIFASILALHNFYKDKSIVYKIIALACFFITAVTTLLTQFRASLIALTVSFVILSIFNKKNLLVLAAVAMIVFLMPGIKNRVAELGFITDVRTKINRLTIEVIKDYPIVGVGFGMQIYSNSNVLDLENYNQKLPFKHQQRNIFLSPHNTFLDIAVRTGIVGLMLFLYAVFSACWMLLKTYRSCENGYFRYYAIYFFVILFSFLISAFFADATFGSQAIVFYVILAMITILWNITNKSSQAKPLRPSTED